MSFFDSLVMQPQDPIFGVQAAFVADPRSEKVNLSVGVYRASNLKTPILQSVKQAEEALSSLEKSKEYFPIEGDLLYLQRTSSLVFGRELSSVAAIQSPGGTGALWLGAKLLGERMIALPEQSWPVHQRLFSSCGLKVEITPYYDLKRQRLDFDAFYSHLKRLAKGSCVLFHACCHNPTGADFSQDEWRALSKLCVEKGAIPFFDFAYQGFKEGLSEDAWAVRAFLEAGHEMLVACSFSKNFGLYGERTGVLFAVTKTSKVTQSHLKAAARTCYSNPPIHGAKIVSHILGDATLTRLWEKEVAGMRQRTLEMRAKLAAALSSRREGFDFLKERHGMFSYLGLSAAQVKRLQEKHAIYMPADSRINVLGLNDENLGRVVEAIVSL